MRQETTLFTWLLLDTRGRRWHPADWGAAIHHPHNRESETMRQRMRFKHLSSGNRNVHCFLLSRTNHFKKMEAYREKSAGDSQEALWETLPATSPNLSVSKDAWNSFAENRMEQAGRWLSPLWFSECSEVRPLWPHRVKPRNNSVLSLRTTQSPARGLRFTASMEICQGLSCFLGRILPEIHHVNNSLMWTLLQWDPHEIGGLSVVGDMKCYAWGQFVLRRTRNSIYQKSYSKSTGH